jgi:hypothetical protein
VNCFYCGNKWISDKYHTDTCGSCGAPKPDTTIEKYHPFFYDGMIVYALRNYDKCNYEWVFYRGAELVGRVDFAMEYIQQVAIPGQDIMPLVLERLRSTDAQSIR